jgi:UDP-N-acetylglucosamine--N-acetylmuramyl-(pentapeptide) pyrophosphoryl-undecaprenol N-acetylglucosamine transferase
MTVLFAGGGTGGHLYPALAIAEAVRKKRPETRIVFIGTADRIEAKVVPEQGYEFRAITVSGLRRSLSLSNLLFPFKIVLSLLQSRKILRELMPAVVVGTGGYVCGPPLYMATKLGIATLIQEQNSSPGVTTRLLAGRVDEVHVTFDITRKYLKNPRKLTVSGNPTRGKIGHVARGAAAKAFGLDPAHPILLVAGGSLGAASLNEALVAAVQELRTEGIQILWSAGESDFGRMSEKIRAAGLSNDPKLVVKPYISNMEDAYGACDLAVCRSGATTLAELTNAGVAAILVPYPHAAADHQRLNGEAMATAGAAVLIPDHAIGAQLPTAVRELLRDSQRMAQMRAAAKSLGKPDAAATIAAAVLQLAGGEYGRAA